MGNIGVIFWTLILPIVTAIIIILLARRELKRIGSKK